MVGFHSVATPKERPRRATTRDMRAGRLRRTRIARFSAASTRRRAQRVRRATHTQRGTTRHPSGARGRCPPHAAPTAAEATPAVVVGRPIRPPRRLPPALADQRPTPLRTHATPPASDGRGAEPTPGPRCAAPHRASAGRRPNRPRDVSEALQASANTALAHSHQAGGRLANASGPRPWRHGTRVRPTLALDLGDRAPPRRRRGQPLCGWGPLPWRITCRTTAPMRTHPCCPLTPENARS